MFNAASFGYFNVRNLFCVFVFITACSLATSCSPPAEISRNTVVSEATGGDAVVSGETAPDNDIKAVDKELLDDIVWDSDVVPVDKGLSYAQFCGFLDHYLKDQNDDYRDAVRYILEKQTRFCAEKEKSESKDDLSIVSFRIASKDGTYPVTYCNPKNSAGFNNKITGMILNEHAVVGLAFTMECEIDGCPCSFYESPKFLDDEFMETIAKVTTLKSLDFTETVITSRGLGTLTRLQQLERFAIRGFPVDQNVIDQLSSFKELRILDLSNPSLSEISLNISSMPELKRLTIFFPKVAASHDFPRSISIENLPRLEYLDMRGEGMHVIKISDLPVLTGINVSFSLRKTSDLNSVSTEFRNLPVLKSLSMALLYPRYDFQFKKLPELRNFSMWYNKSENESDFWNGIESLSQSTRLEKLELVLPPGPKIDLSLLNRFSVLEKLKIRDIHLENHQTRTISGVNNIKSLKLEFSNKQGTYIVENMSELEKLDLTFQKCDTLIVRNCPKLKTLFHEWHTPKFNHVFSSGCPKLDTTSRLGVKVKTFESRDLEPQSEPRP